MLGIDIDRVNGIVTIEPRGPLGESDFADLAALIDPYVEANNSLRGLIIHTREFPGWDSFGAMVSHMRFVRDHHERIGKIALVTDSAVGDLAETIGGHFVVATVRHYDFDDRDSARAWMLQG
jgi:hypothetical protein